MKGNQCLRSLIENSQPESAGSAIDVTVDASGTSIIWTVRVCDLRMRIDGGGKAVSNVGDGVKPTDGNDFGRLTYQNTRMA